MSDYEKGRNDAIDQVIKLLTGTAQDYEQMAEREAKSEKTAVDISKRQHHLKKLDFQGKAQLLYGQISHIELLRKA